MPNTEEIPSRWFTLTVHDGNAYVSISEFVAIITELEQRGIDVTVLQNGENSLRFKFKESPTQ